MNTGIQDAVVLACLLTDVLTGNASDDHLDTYETRRRPVAQEVVSMTDRMTRAATAAGPLTRTVRNTLLGLVGGFGPVQRKLAMNLSELATDPTRETYRPAHV